FVDRAFYMDKYPVSNQQYAWFIEDTGHEAPKHWMDGQFSRGEEALPVTNISYQDASNYAEWIGNRLPTAIEWLRANPNDFVSTDREPIKEWTSSEFSIQPEETGDEEWLEDNPDASSVYRAIVYGTADQGLQPWNEYDHAQDIGFRTVLDPT